MECIVKKKEDFLRQFLKLDNGVPSHDTRNRAFSLIESAHFNTCFTKWVSTLAELSPKKIVAIAGKTIRVTKTSGPPSPLHLVSAWACQNNVCLGRVKTTEKSNENSSKSAIP